MLHFFKANLGGSGFSYYKLLKLKPPQNVSFRNYFRVQLFAKQTENYHKFYFPPLFWLWYWRALAHLPFFSVFQQFCYTTKNYFTCPNSGQSGLRGGFSPSICQETFTTLHLQHEEIISQDKILTLGWGTWQWGWNILENHLRKTIYGNCIRRSISSWMFGDCGIETENKHAEKEKYLRITKKTLKTQKRSSEQHRHSDKSVLAYPHRPPFPITLPQQI